MRSTKLAKNQPRATGATSGGLKLQCIIVAKRMANRLQLNIVTF